MNNIRRRVREELLLDGLEGAVPLTVVDSHVTRLNPAIPISELQKETLETVRSLVSDGLFSLGAMSGDDGSWVEWNEPLATSMQKISDAYVNHYDDPAVWIWAAWMKLTDNGKQVARALGQESTDPV